MASVDSKSDQLAGKTVQELQAIAAEAALAARIPRRNQRRSRSAQLHLIDQLSRWGGSGLALIAGVSIFIALVPARDLPVRTAVWASLVFGSLYLCRRYRKEFRRGDRISSRPFRWRAYYASTLAVVSAAFGSGALLLSQPPNGSASIETLGLMTIAALGAAAFHAPHRASAAAAGIPAFSAIFLSAVTGFGFSVVTVAILGAGLIASALVAMLALETEKRASNRFPRTSLIRREAGHGKASHIGRQSAERAAG